MQEPAKRHNLVTKQQQLTGYLLRAQPHDAQRGFLDLRSLLNSMEACSLMILKQFQTVRKKEGKKGEIENTNEIILKIIIYSFKELLWDFSMVQWLEPQAPNAGDPGLIPCQGIRAHMLQLRVH